MNITFPVPQDNIKEVLKACSEEYKRLNAELNIIIKLMKMVQDCCSHPNTKSGNTWGRWPYTECTICGKEW